MFLQPKKIKNKKVHKGKLKNYNFKSSKLKFGNIGLKALSSGTITAKQIEAARQSINRKIKRKGKIWIRIFPFVPITKKPMEVRMGKGKGSISHWSVKVRKGTILFELCTTSISKSILAFKTGGAKLPIKTVITLL